jgi:hypothetical protein
MRRITGMGMPVLLFSIKFNDDALNLEEHFQEVDQLGYGIYEMAGDQPQRL